ncbi:general odorant-binding protein 83a-like [Venturia canescens]|uniref:general odorant-binding protein 83a-like n=1 Tax=Venturia canescens TaxID=32260 RepID=UPI001C9D6473|nr:general odorant-binding protein 83a-like [Venturia canescens]
MSIPIVLGLLILCLADIGAITNEMKQMAQVLHDACVEETGVQERLIEECRKGVFSEDSNLKCYIKCLMTKVPLMTEDGDIDEDFIIKVMPAEFKEIAIPVVRACGTVKGADHCETAFLTNKCWHSKSPEHYYLV